MQKGAKLGIPEWMAEDQVETFDVTCTIGQVAVNNYGEGESPIMAAFRLIADHDSCGRFAFTFRGMTQWVTIEREMNQA